MNRLKFLVACCVLAAAGIAQTGEIRGKITGNLKEAVPFAIIRILQDNHLITGAQADEDGEYSCKPLTPGHYELIVSEAGHITQPVRSIRVIANEATYVDVKLQPNTMGTIEVVAPPYDYTQSGVDRTMYSIVTIDAKDLNRNASYNQGNIEGALSSISSNFVEGPGGGVHLRGARAGTTGYFVDGVRTLNAASVPGHAVENISVFTGGVPAMYGDLTSGVVFITTKSYFSGIREKNIRRAEMEGE